MPSVSSAQHGAMCLAAAGKSTLGIPEKVGKEFCAADRGKRVVRRKKRQAKHLRRK